MKGFGIVEATATVVLGVLSMVIGSVMFLATSGEGFFAAMAMWIFVGGVLVSILGPAWYMAVRPGIKIAVQVSRYGTAERRRRDKADADASETQPDGK